MGVMQEGLTHSSANYLLQVHCVPGAMGDQSVVFSWWKTGNKQASTYTFNGTISDYGLAMKTLNAGDVHKNELRRTLGRVVNLFKGLASANVLGLCRPW